MAKLDWYIRSSLKFSHLQLLVALDEFRSVGRVAGYLNISQPAVSKSLSALESSLGLTLFNRSTRSLMEPTEHGECLIRYAHYILKLLTDAEEELQEISEGRTARVSIGVLPSAATVLVPRFVSHLNASATAVTVSVREGTMETLLPMLRAGDIDLVVGNQPARPLGTEFVTELLCDDPIVVVVGHHHPLAKVENPTWKMLNGYPLVLPTADASTRTAIDDHLTRQKVEIPKKHLESLSTLTNIGVCQFTDSVGFSPRMLAEHFSKLGILKVLPLSFPNVNIRLVLVWLANQRRTKAHQLIQEQFRQTRDTLIESAPLPYDVGK